MLSAEAAATQGLSWLAPIAKNLSKGSVITPYPTGGLVLRGRLRINQHVGDSDTFCDEDDPSSSGTVISLLDTHLDGVSTLAGRFAVGCGLFELVETFKAAGCGHDLGKADSRFQAWLKGGNPWPCGPLLAKSEKMAQGRKESEAARKRAGYPLGGRHELVSVRLLDSCLEILPDSEEMRDLLLHLVASHHGYCRPFAPVVEDTVPVHVSLFHQERHYCANSMTTLERVDSGVAERFWSLTRRYGWWGLAWLEAILRLADHRRSEWEENHARETENE